jgi:hypothetical protein
MGMGCNFDFNGHNVIFAGGTGILVFLDLIAVTLFKFLEVKTYYIASDVLHDVSNEHANS